MFGPDSKKMLQAMSRYSYLGIFFGIAILIGYLGGSWLDRRFHTEPWIQILGVLFGIAAGFRELFRLAKLYQKEMRES